MKPTLKKALRRQTQLTAKLMSGKITKNERAELKVVNEQIRKATDPQVVTRKTTLKTMTLKEFKAWAEKVAANNPSADDLAILKRNLAAVKDQGVTDSEGIVAVEMLVAEKTADTISRLEARIAQLEAKASGEEENSEEDDSEEEESEDDDSSDEEDGKEKKNKADAPTTLALALEALTASIEKLEMLKGKFEGGTVTMEDVYKAWPDYEVREMIEGAAGVLAKCEALTSLINEVVPKIKALQDDGEGEEETPEDENTDSNDNGDSETEKSAEVKKFFSGSDMSPRSQGGTQDYQLIRKTGVKDRKPGSFYK